MTVAAPVVISHGDETSGEFKFSLSSGVMRLRLDFQDIPLDDMLQMAERNNPRRAFLFVSTVLGRHIPVKPSRHRDALTRLAGKLSGPLVQAEGPVLVMGYAETAVGLGAGVHDALFKECGRSDMVYLPSTRHPGGKPVWFAFSEDHSHAQGHHVLRPSGKAGEVAASARTIILVDDEVTTGNTFSNLLCALMQHAPREIDHVHLVTLTDWSGGKVMQHLAEKSGLPVERFTAHSLIGGNWDWEPAAGFAPRSLPAEIAPLNVDGVDARYGEWRAGLMGETPVDTAPLARHITSPDRPVLVIGTGENVWHPMRLAEELENDGYAVEFIATTRSPVRQGETIRRKISFVDHYGLGLPMYLHNVDPDRYGAIFLMIERADVQGICPELARGLSDFTAVSPDGACYTFRDGVLSA
jgi:hypothetical protein